MANPVDHPEHLTHWDALKAGQQVQTSLTPDMTRSAGLPAILTDTSATMEVSLRRGKRLRSNGCLRSCPGAMGSPTPRMIVTATFHSSLHWMERAGSKTCVRPSTRSSVVSNTGHWVCFAGYCRRIYASGSHLHWSYCPRIVRYTKPSQRPYAPGSQEH